MSQQVEKIYCVEYRPSATVNDGTLRRYICKAADADEAKRMAYSALGRNI